MEIQIKQNTLAKALNIVSRIAGGAKATLPILNNVLIRAQGEKVSLTTTNLDMAVVDYLPVKAVEDGVITVPARLLAEFVANLPRENVVKITTKGTKVVTEAGKYSSTMNGAGAEDFPELPEMDEEKAVKIKVGVDEFRTGINQVIIATSNDMTRPALTGVFFNSQEEKLYVAGTDGYRLAEKKLMDKIGEGVEVKAIVPTAGLQEVMRSIGEGVEEIEILFDESQVKFRMGEIELTSKLIDGSYPDYRKLIPEGSEIGLVLPKDELVRVTKLAGLFAKEVGGSIVCEASKEKGGFSVASVANEFGENDSVIEAEIENEGKVTLNSKFLMDALNALEEEKVYIEFSTKLTPVVVKNEKSSNYTHIVMPLKMDR